MGLIARLKKFTRVSRNDVDLSVGEINIGGGDIVTAEHFEDAGSDTHPLVGDYVAAVSIPRSGGKIIVGYFDPKYTPKAELGEKIIYARDEEGALVVELWLKNDGTAVLQNDKGSFELRPDGSMRGEHENGSFELKVTGAFRAENVAGSHELLADGSIKGENSNGSFELEEGGDFLVNTVRIDTQGNITATSVQAPSMIAGQKELAEHLHGGVDPGGGVSGPNL